MRFEVQQQSVQLGRRRLPAPDAVPDPDETADTAADEATDAAPDTASNAATDKAADERANQIADAPDVNAFKSAVNESIRKSQRGPVYVAHSDSIHEPINADRGTKC